MNRRAPAPQPDPAPSPGSRSRWWRAAAWAATGLGLLTGLAAIAVIFLLQSAWFHHYALNTVEEQASGRLGAQVQLENYRLDLSTLSLDLYGLTIHGASPYPNPPLLQVQHAAVSVRVVSLLQRKWYLDTFRVDRPVVNVFTDAHGISNIPVLKSSGGGSHTSVFDLGVRHAVLQDGEVYYNNRKTPLEADLHGLDFQSSYDSLLQKYSGHLSYQDGLLRTASFNPVPHRLDARFDATPSAFHLTEAKISSGSSNVLLTASLNDYSHPRIQAHYEAKLDGSEIRHILQNPSVPAGLLQTSGSLLYQETPGLPLLKALALDGELSSNQLWLQTPQLRAEVQDLGARYSLQNGDAAVRGLHAHLLGGDVTATALMTGIAGDSHSTVKASLRGLSLAALRRMVQTPATLRDVAITGALNAEANASWGKTLNDLAAHADATIHGRISGAGAAQNPTPALPIDSVIHGSYSGIKEQLTLSKSYLRMPQTSLNMDGVVSRRSSLGVRFQSQDLGELETIADLFRKPAPGQPALPLGLAGSASFQGVLRGSTSAPHLTGQLAASNFRVHGTQWRVLRASVDASPSFARLQHADLEPATGGRISFDAGTGLTKWSFTKNSSFEIGLDASKLNISELAKTAGSQLPLSGTLDANLAVHGTELHPVGRGKLSIAHAKAEEEPIDSAQLTFSGSGDEVHGNLTVRLPAGSLQAQTTLRPQAKSYVAQLTADGLHLDQLKTLQAKNIEAKGVLKLHAAGQGTFENPQLAATVEIPRLEIQKQTITGLNLTMNVADHVATAKLVSQAVNTSIRANARVNLTGAYFAEAQLDTQPIPLQPLLEVYLPSQAGDLSGETELHATMRGPLKNRKLIEAHLTIPTLKAAYSNTVQLAAVSPIHVDYKNSVIAIQPAAIRGTDTDLRFQGSIPVGAHAPASLLLLGTVNLQLAQLFDTDTRSSGELKFNINSYGARTSPDVQGQIQIVNANFSNGDLPIGLQNGNGVLTLTNDRLNVEKFEGVVGGGTLTAQGGVSYRPTVQFDLGLAAKGVRMLYPQGVRESINADLRFTGTTESALLGGTVSLSDLSFTPAFDLTNFINQFSGGVAPPPTPGMAQNIRLNLGVHSANSLNLVSRALSINGTANLQLRGTAAQPVILGRINLNSGDVIFNSDRFVLNGGTVEFVNPAETEPVVNLALMTTIQQYNIALRFNGPIDQLRTNYTSDPSLPAADIINLLAFGQTTEANAANPSTPANQAAESLIASQVSSQITSRVSRIAGISQLSINPVLEGGSSQGPAGANITIQQRVTGNFFVTFSSNVSSTQNQTIMGQYQLSPRVGVSATRDQNGGFGFDTTIKKTW
ncbi:MAG TPA: translocation/assembly module TamB domain-containing protein [Acidobacteriaceae bacterium]|nr:translocation/assembly module TamB domain-containing protein [Acidobacteriaceae bacterium]